MLSHAMTDTTFDRWHKKVDFYARTGPGHDCWEWRGALNPNGYGVLTTGRSGDWRNDGAHRVSYALHKGPVPAGLVVRHACDNRSCVNPAHLDVGTHSENEADKTARGRRPVGNAHCNPVRGERHHWSRLSEHDIGQIRLGLDSGVPGKDLAAKYGVTPSCISHIKRGKSRKRASNAG